MTRLTEVELAAIRSRVAEGTGTNFYTAIADRIALLTELDVVNDEPSVTDSAAYRALVAERAAHAVTAAALADLHSRIEALEAPPVAA